MLDDRFWTKVDKTHPSGCWVWTANKNNKGYGLFRPGGSAPKQLAHRLSFEDANGPIPDGGLILHSCDNPLCVNPAHLRVGDHKQNVADMDQRGRRVTNTPRGGKNWNTTTTARRVVAIRKAYVAGVAIDTICTRYGITRAALSDYVRGKSWAHILGVKGCPGLPALQEEAKRRRRNGAKIDAAKAAEIKTRISNGERGVDLAVEFGIHAATVSDIRRGKIWPD